MTASNTGDDVAALIAGYATAVSDDLDPRIERAAKAVLVDSIAVALGALVSALALWTLARNQLRAVTP